MSSKNHELERWLYRQFEDIEKYKYSEKYDVEYSNIIKIYYLRKYGISIDIEKYGLLLECIENFKPLKGHHRFVRGFPFLETPNLKMTNKYLGDITLLMRNYYCKIIRFMGLYIYTDEKEDIDEEFILTTKRILEEDIKICCFVIGDFEPVIIYNPAFKE